MKFGAIKIHYLLLYGTIGAFLPYQSLYYQSRGMDETWIGWVVGINGLAVILMPGIMSHLADRHLSNRTLMRGCYGCAALALALMGLSQNHWALLCWTVLLSLGITPLVILLDGLVFTALHDIEERGEVPPPFYHFRIWGSIGFMLPAVALYLLMAYTAFSLRDAMWLSAGYALFGAGYAVALPNTKPKHDKDETSLPSAMAIKALSTGPTMVFVGSLFMLSAGISIFYPFYMLQLEALNVDGRWMGLILNLGVLAEIGLIVVSGRILHAVGMRGVMIIGAASLVVRLLLLAVFPSVAVAVLSQLLHAPLVLALYLVPPMYLNHKAGPKFRNSMQGLYLVICGGGARMFGTITGGYLADVKLEYAFLYGALLSLIATLWLAFGFRDDEACEVLRQKSGHSIDASVPEG